MVKVANLSADLTANTTSFDKSLSKARRQLSTTGKSMSKNANDFNKSVSNSFRRAAQSAAAFEGPLGGIAGRLGGLASIATTTGVALGGALLALGGFVVVMGKGVKVADQYEGSINRLNAILKATGGASGQSAEGIRAFSEELAAGTLESVGNIEAASAKLLTFRRISGDTFKRTIVLAQDLAASGFGSLTDNVTQLGKALEDPIRNLGALTRNGVSFSQAQKDMINSLVETGRAVEAQTIILDALAQQVGGAGAAEGGAISKGLDLLSQRFDEFTISLAKASGAARLTTRFISGLNIILEGITPGELPLTQQLKDAEAALRSFVEFNEENETTGMLGVGERVVALTLVVDNLKLAIEAEKAQADAILKTAQAAQKKIQTEFEANKVTKKNLEISKLATKEAERRQKAIDNTIESLSQQIAGLNLENASLESNIVSIEKAALAREILNEQQKLGLEVGSAEAQQIEDLVRNRDKLSESISTEQKARKKAESIINDNKTATQKLNDELRIYKELLDEGLLTQEQYNEAVDRTREEIDELVEVNKDLEKTMDDVSDSVSSAFEDFAFGAKSAGDAVKQLALDLARLAFKEATSGLLSNVVGAAFSAFSSTGSGVSPEGDFVGGSFAGGGRPPLGKLSMVGEEGPELFVPDSSGTIIPNDALTGGQSGPTIYADMRGASVEAVQRLEIFVDQLNGSIEPRAISAVAGEKQRNPQLFGVQ